LTGAFLAAIRAEGGKGAFVVKTGTSDMNVLARHYDCPILAYGPGDSSLDHTPEERLDLDEYLRACRVVQGVIVRLGTERGSASALPLVRVASRSGRPAFRPEA